MKKACLLLFSLLLCLGLSAKDFKAGTSVYVINYLGTELKSRPSENARTISSLVPGERLEILHSTQKSASQKVHMQLELTGTWLEVKRKDQSGYVFSGDLSDIPPSLSPNQPTTTFPQLLGKKQGTKEAKDTVELYGKNYPVSSKVTLFENATYTVSAYQDCFSHIYTFDKLSFNEVFHHMRNGHLLFDENSGDFIAPRLIKRNETTLVFQLPDSDNEIRLVIQKNGSIDIQQFSCHG
ncbi:hypothetical protein GCM10028791_32820 [Echinicola sediminis]